MSADEKAIFWTLVGSFAAGVIGFLVFIMDNAAKCDANPVCVQERAAGEMSAEGKARQVRWEKEAAERDAAFDATMQRLGSYWFGTVPGCWAWFADEGRKWSTNPRVVCEDGMYLGRRIN